MMAVLGRRMVLAPQPIQGFVCVSSQNCFPNVMPGFQCIKLGLYSALIAPAKCIGVYNIKELEIIRSRSTT